MPTDHFIEDRDDRVPVDIAIDGKTGALDFKTLKTGGIIKQRQKDKFTVRLKCPGGRIPLERLTRIAEVARKYAGDFVHVSVRQSIELPFVDHRNIGHVQKELAEVGQEIASCGPRVRVPTACAGCEYNPNGLTDSQKMAAETCERFFGKRRLPHKFKIVFSGCPNDCVRTNSCDLGFQGAVRPELDPASCIRCGICAHACIEDAVVSAPDSGEPVFHPEKCLYCADCIRACPTGSWRAGTTGWMVRCGGKHGRHPINGAKIAEFVPDEKVPEIIEAVLSWYEKSSAGKGRIRIGTLLLDEAAWREFVAQMRPTLGDYAVPNPPPPQRNEIHLPNA